MLNTSKSVPLSQQSYSYHSDEETEDSDSYTENLDDQEPEKQIDQDNVFGSFLLKFLRSLGMNTADGHWPQLAKWMQKIERSFFVKAILKPLMTPFAAYIKRWMRSMQAQQGRQRRLRDESLNRRRAFDYVERVPSGVPSQETIIDVAPTVEVPMPQAAPSMNPFAPQPVDINPSDLAPLASQAWMSQQTSQGSQLDDGKDATKDASQGHSDQMPGADAIKHQPQSTLDIAASMLTGAVRLAGQIFGAAMHMAMGNMSMTTAPQGPAPQHNPATQPQNATTRSAMNFSNHVQPGTAVSPSHTPNVAQQNGASAGRTMLPPSAGA